MAANLVGEKAPRWGQTHTPAARQKMSATKRAAGLKGPKSASWRGGTYRSRGYVMVKMDALTEAERLAFGSMVNVNRERGDYIAQHRLVVARSIGRPLATTEHVHHINGVKDDNRLENLAIQSAEDHRRTHVQVERDLLRLQRENALLRQALLKCCVANAHLRGSTTST